ncbi:MAG TPA: hypothetical protein V6C65_12265 [Allocoleopsis sp.]
MEEDSDLIKLKYFEFELKRVIEFLYKDGVDRIVFWADSVDGIFGVFQDGDRFFEFTVYENGEIEYSPAKGGTRKDAYSIPRFNRNKKKRCSGGKSYSCGNSCISNSKKCRIGLSEKEKDVTQRLMTNRTSAVDLAAAESGARLYGVPTPVYAVYRERYRSNYPNSLEKAKKMSKEVEIEDIKEDKDTIVFTIGGISGDDKSGYRLKDKIDGMGIPNTHTVRVSNMGFDVRTKEEEEQGIDRGIDGKPVGAEFPVRTLRLFTRTAIQERENPAAIRAAANAIAYKEKYPGKKIAIVGHSGGGMAAREAAELLEMKGQQVKVIAIGSPHLGLNSPTKDTTTIATTGDPILKVSKNSVMNGVWINEIQGHGLENYLTSGAVRSYMKESLGNSKKRMKRSVSKKKRSDSLSLQELESILAMA